MITTFCLSAKVLDTNKLVTFREVTTYGKVVVASPILYCREDLNIEPEPHPAISITFSLLCSPHNACQQHTALATRAWRGSEC